MNQPASQPANPRDYQFTIHHHAPDELDPYEDWRVTLPHQCSSWVITGDEWELEPITHEQAVEEMEQFVTQATQALDKLRRKETD